MADLCLAVGASSQRAEDHRFPYGGNSVEEPTSYAEAVVHQVEDVNGNPPYRTRRGTCVFLGKFLAEQSW